MVEVTGQAETVTIRVAALEGYHALLHHTATFCPSTAGGSLGAVPQQATGALAFSD
jgi:hypothetical protein